MYKLIILVAVLALAGCESMYMLERNVYYGPAYPACPPLDLRDSEGDIVYVSKDGWSAWMLTETEDEVTTQSWNYWESSCEAARAVDKYGLAEATAHHGVDMSDLKVYISDTPRHGFSKGGTGKTQVIRNNDGAWVGTISEQ